MTAEEARIEQTASAIADWLEHVAKNPANPDINPLLFALQVECLNTAAQMVRRGDWKSK